MSNIIPYVKILNLMSKYYTKYPGIAYLLCQILSQKYIGIRHNMFFCMIIHTIHDLLCKTNSCIHVSSSWQPNNGNKGTDSKFSVKFGTHKQFYSFLLFSMEQLSDSEDNIEALLTATAKARKYLLFEDLKESQEACKASLTWFS